MGSTSTPAARRKRAVESFGTCASALQPIQREMALFAITRGQWSMIDAILVVLDSVPGPCDISLWTWTVAEYEVQCLTRLMRDGRLSGGRLVIDIGARNKNAHIIADWRELFGADSVAYVTNHAKIARVADADGGRYLLRGSMNLNANPRFEQFDLTEGGPDYDMIERVEAELPTVAQDATFKEARRASKVHASWTDDQLTIFGKGLKPWAK